MAYDASKPVTPTNNSAADAVVTPAAVSTPEPVTFSDAQQAKIDEIVKSAMGRAAADTRQRLSVAEHDAQKQRERADALAKDLLIQSRANAPDAEESDKLRAQLATTTREKEELQESLKRQQREAMVLAVARKHEFVNEQQVLRLLDIPESASVEEVHTIVAKFANDNDHLVRGSTRSGSGSGPDSRGPQVAPVYTCEQLFGRGSNASLANRIAISRPDIYKSLKAEARRKGLVG